MADLRNARVLHSRFGPSLGAAEGGWERETLATRAMYRRDADAVIAELGLHPVESLDRRFIRWVTAWRNNPELSDSHE